MAIEVMATWAAGGDAATVKVRDLVGTGEEACAAGEPDMAIAAFRAALKVARTGGVLGAGYVELKIAEVLYHHKGDREAALPYARSAEASLTAEADRRPPGAEAAVAGAKRVLAKLLLEVGRELELAGRLLGAARDLYRRLEDGRAALDCEHVLAGLLEQQGRADDALAGYQRLCAAFLEIGDEKSAADAMTNAARLLAAGSAPEAALEMIERAIAIYARTDDVNSHAELLSVKAEVHMHLLQPKLALSALNEALAIYTSRDRAVDAALCQQNLASVHVALGDLAAAEQCLLDAQAALKKRPMGFALAKNGIARASLVCNDDPARARAILDEIRDEIAGTDIDVRAWFVSEDARVAAALGEDERAVTLLAQAGPDLVASGQPRGAALVDVNRAVLLERLGRTDEALIAIRAALRRIEAHRYGLRGPDRRAAWSSAQTDAFTTALRLALSRDDRATIAAELVETARAQAVPAGPDRAAAVATPLFPLPDAPAPPPTETRDPAAKGRSSAFAAIGALPLEAPPPIGVHGPSWLAPDDADPEASVRLERVAELVGGPGAWWWGTWVTGGRLWRAVVRPDGVVDADSVDFGPHSEARLAVDKHGRGLVPPTHDWEALSKHVRASPLAEHPVSERRLALRLGQALLPESLRAEIARRVAHDEAPLPLVVAPAPALARLSFDLLAVAWGMADVDTPSGPDPRRLVEGAVVRLGPSAAFVDALTGRRRWADWVPPPAGAPVVAVIDPTGNLPNSRPVNRFYDVNLEGWEATMERVRQSVARLSPEGVLYYAGHGKPAPAGGPSEAGLVLHDGVLTARMLIHPEPGAEYRIPRRVFVRGCSTSGADGGGRGEWLTVAPALLWAGARSVVATAWDLLDHPDSSTADLTLLERVRGPGDPADAVREHHLDRLAAWRAIGTPWTVGPPPLDDDTILPIGYPAPLLWAHHVVVGLHGG